MEFRIKHMRSGGTPLLSCFSFQRLWQLWSLCDLSVAFGGLPAMVKTTVERCQCGLWAHPISPIGSAADCWMTRVLSIRWLLCPMTRHWSDDKASTVIVWLCTHHSAGLLKAFNHLGIHCLQSTSIKNSPAWSACRKLATIGLACDR